MRQVKLLLDRKLDKNDFKIQIETKTNKKEYEIVESQILILQKQLASISNLQGTHTKMEVEQMDTTEPANRRKLKWANFLHQVMCTQNWIQGTDLSKVDDFFDKKEYLVPTDVV